MTTAHRTTPSLAEPAPDRPFRGRRLTWEEFERVYGPRSRPANDNEKEERNAECTFFMESQVIP